MSDRKKILFKQGAVDAFEKKIFHVNWLLTDACNYSCSYCFGNGPKKISEGSFATKKQLLNAADRIIRLEKEYYSVYLAGGEPTLHPHLADIIKIFSEDDKCTIAITTNLSKCKNYFLNLASLSNNNFFIEASIHFDHITNIDNVIEKIKSLAPHISMIHIMAHPNKMQEVKKFYNSISLIAQPFELNAYVRIIRNGYSVSKEYSKSDFEWVVNLQQLDYRKAKGFSYSKEPITWEYGDMFSNNYYSEHYNRNDLTAFCLDNFKNMFCLSGNIIRISANGTTRQGVCDGFDTTFNIFNEEFPAEFFNPVICRVNRCSCTANHFTPKFINPMDAPIYISKNQLLSAVYNYLRHKRHL